MCFNQKDISKTMSEGEQRRKADKGRKGEGEQVKLSDESMS